jgi:hypothetical protein
MVAKHLFILLIFGLFLFTFAAGVNAQSSDDRWRGLNDLKPGTRLVIDQDGAASLKVKFANSTDQSIAVTAKGKRIDIDRSTITAIYLGRKSSKVKRGLIGALAGAGAGLLVGAVAVAATKESPLIGAGTFLYGIPIGAAIGVATAGGTKKGELLYNR